MVDKKETGIKLAIAKLLAGGPKIVPSRLTEVVSAFNIPNTLSKAYCHFIAIDSDGNVQKQKLIEYLVFKVCDYAIPRAELHRARNKSNREGTSYYTEELGRRARRLFVKQNTTGEVGELLLYIMAEEVLGFPQLLTKMSLKTSPEQHVNGADGVHFKYDCEENVLGIYWGEAKMKANAREAIKDCVEGIKDYLTSEGASRIERDICLIRSHMHDELPELKRNIQLRKALVDFFNPDTQYSNNVSHRGICFIGYDSDVYKKPRKDLLEGFQSEFSKYFQMFASYAEKWSLTMKEIHVFFLPFSSVREFREIFLDELIAKKR